MKDDGVPPVSPPHEGFLITFDPPPSPHVFHGVFFHSHYFRCSTLRVLRGVHSFFILISLALCISRGAGLFSLIFSLFAPPPCILHGLGFILYFNLLSTPSHSIQNARVALLLCFFRVIVIIYKML